MGPEVPCERLQHHEKKEEQPNQDRIPATQPEPGCAQEAPQAGNNRVPFRKSRS
jgi:hypothetical protein